MSDKSSMPTSIHWVAVERQRFIECVNGFNNYPSKEAFEAMYRQMMVVDMSIVNMLENVQVFIDEYIKQNEDRQIQVKNLISQVEVIKADYQKTLNELSKLEKSNK